MGILDIFATRKVETITPKAGADVSASLAPVTSIDSLTPFFGGAQTATREQAMSVPSCARARNIICSSIASIGLHVIDRSTGMEIEDATPRVIRTPDPRIPGSATYVWTCEDILFYGYGYWQITELFADTYRVRSVQRVSPARVTIQTNSIASEIEYYMVDGTPVPNSGIGSLVVFNGNDDLLHILDASWDENYLNAMLPLVQNSEAIDKVADTPIVFTSIHGTGITMVPPLLKRMGFKNLHVVEEQAKPDGNFPTVKSPNPEERDALSMAIALAEQTNAAWVLGTDPDADRVGLCVRDHTGQMALLNGNQTGAILAYHQLKQKGKVHPSGLPYFTARTIVTSALIEDIATSFGVPCYSTLTGFKYIAAVIREREGKEKFLVGGEESYGYLIGDDVRDKDAVISAAALSEAGAHALANGSSLWDLLMKIYAQYGLYHEELVSITLKGLDGVQKIKAMMSNFRANAPQSLGGKAVVELRDYQLQKATLSDGTTYVLEQPQSDVLQFILEDGSTISARPSGTEPKIKFYFSMKDAFKGQDEYYQQVEEMKQRMKHIEQELIGNN
jgi:phosphomannomutase